MLKYSSTGNTYDQSHTYAYYFWELFTDLCNRPQYNIALKYTNSIIPN